MQVKALLAGAVVAAGGLALPAVPAVAASQPKVHVNPAKAWPGSHVHVQAPRRGRFATVTSAAFTDPVQLNGSTGTATIRRGIAPGTYSVRALDADSRRMATGHVKVGGLRGGAADIIGPSRPDPRPAAGDAVPASPDRPRAADNALQPFDGAARLAEPVAAAPPPIDRKGPRLQGPGPRLPNGKMPKQYNDGDTFTPRHPNAWMRAHRPHRAEDRVPRALKDFKRQPDRQARNPMNPGRHLGQRPQFPGKQSGFPGKQSGFPGKQSGFPGKQSGFPGKHSQFPGQRSQFPGMQSGFPGQRSQFPGKRSQFPGQRGQLPWGQRGQFPSQRSQFPGKHSQFPGRQSRFPGKQGQFPGQHRPGHFKEHLPVPAHVSGL